MKILKYTASFSSYGSVFVFWSPSTHACQKKRVGGRQKNDKKTKAHDGDELRSSSHTNYIYLTHRTHPRHQIEHLHTCELYILVHNTSEYPHLVHSLHLAAHMVRPYTHGFRKPPAQKGDVQIPPVQKKTLSFGPLEADGQAEGNQ